MKTTAAIKMESVQFLRALAVILVVYVHTIDSSSFTHPIQRNFFHLENWGAIGLDLFFVISGFIMTVITPNYISNNNWKDFLIKRAIRVLPLYWILSAFCFIVSEARGSGFKLLKILKTLIFLPLFDSSFTFPIIPVGWSLSLEVYFYLLIAVLIAFVPKRIYSVLLVALLLLATAGSLFNPQVQLIRFLLSPFLAEFAFGIVAGLVFRYVSGRPAESYQPAQKWLVSGSTILGFGLMLTSLFLGFDKVDDAAFVGEHPQAALYRTIIWGLPCAIFLNGFVLLEYLYKLKMPAFMVKLGDASYACYLLHTIITIPVAMKLFKIAGLENGDLYILFSLLITVTGSIIFYHYFERNLNRVIFSTYSARKNVVRNPLQFSTSSVAKVVAKLRKGN